ncbi:MAG: PTS sugar transporter subunit IIA [Sarcina sp.]
MHKIIDLNLIKLATSEKEKKEVLKLIAKIAFENDIVESQNRYFEGLVQRESQCTTGFGKGFAIPHCKSDTVKKPAIIVCKLKNSIEWEAMDDKPVNFVLGLAIPEAEAGTTHLKILSQVARLLMDDKFTNQLNNANTIQEIYLLLDNKIEGGI